MHRVRTGILLSLCCTAAHAGHADFPGWQGLRVIEQKGRPSLMRTADLNGDGREELIVVNSRSSRLDIYRWRENAAGGGELPDAARPNELPFAPDLEHRELQLENIPRDALAHDLDGDGQPELVVLVSSPNQVLVYRYQDERWQKQYKIDLLDGDIPTRRNLLLVRQRAAGERQLLVSMDNGIQELSLKPGGQAKWMTPREQRGRMNWWLADLDGDGREDLIEQTREANESVRWYRASASGALTPAAVLRDQAVKDVEVLRTGSATQVVILDGTVANILRRYDLEHGEINPFGQQLPLALDDGPRAVWCGMWQGDRRALVVADPDAPRLLSYELDAASWGTQQAYPGLTDILAMETLQAKRGTLLLWTKDAADLRKSHWESGRLTYPEPWPQSAEIEDRKILSLDSVGSITWWVQRVEKHLDLYVSRPQMEQPERIRFLQVGAKADQVLWLGGERLLVKETHSRALKLVVLDGEKAKVTSPTHLKKATLGEFKLFAVNEEVRLGRLTDGVMQWLGDDLRSQEQVMLPQGQQLADYAVESETCGWALQHDSPFVHRIEIDGSRLSESIERIKLVEGTGLVKDPVLGMLLLGQDRVTHLSKGQAQELKLIDAIDERVGRAGGVRKTRFHRLGVTDIDGDGYEDLVLYDDLQHRLTVVGKKAGDQVKGALVPKIAWPVFDDKVYPYNDESENLVKEPRAVVAFDVDGDRLQDLAILSHDRLLLYLAKERSVH